jgi:hypothetical protein
MRSLQFDVGHLLAGGMLIFSFLLLYRSASAAARRVRSSCCRA